MKQKRTFDPYIELQDELLGQIHHALQGGIILQIKNWSTDDFEDRYERTLCIAKGSKIDNHFMSDVYKLCLDVKKALEFDEEVDFYLTENSTVNATAYLSMIEGKPHIINIYSGLFNLLDEEELKAIIGHEIGHLINKDRWLDEIIDFVYPDEEKCPLYLKRRVDLYNLLAELSADRYGYLANRNLEASISSMYKLSTGVNIWKHEVDLPGMLKNNNMQLDQLLKEGVATHTTHPFDPIRIKALELFANSKSDENLDKDMDVLISLLMEAGQTEEDKYMMDYIITAGMMMALADGEATLSEHNAIIEKLGEITLAPEAYFEKVSKGDIAKTYDQAVNKLRALGKEAEMLRYLAEISLSDGRIDEGEVAELLHFGEDLKCPKEVVAMIIGQVIREQYRPLAINMSKPEKPIESQEAGSEVIPDSNNDIKPDEVDEHNEITPKFTMDVCDKTVDRSHRLMLCGKVNGIVNRNDKVIITNGEKTFEDVVFGIKVRYSFPDSTMGVDPKEEIELCMTTTTLRDIDGKIKEWKVIGIDSLDTDSPDINSVKEEKKQRKPRKSKKETEEEEPEIEMEVPEIEWEIGDDERTEPSKANTLYLPIRQKYFDEIIEGTKKVEFREIGLNTYKKYIETDKEGNPLLEEDYIHDDSCYNFIFGWNEGECPFRPKDIQYLDLAVGYNRERDTAKVEVVGYSFIPLKDEKGNVIRFFWDSEVGKILNEEGDHCHWIIALHLGKILECKRANK